MFVCGYVCFTDALLHILDYAAKFAAITRESLYFLVFTENCRLAVTSPFNNETLKSLFWIEANYHHPVDLPYTSGPKWRVAIIWCLESVYPRFGSLQEPDPVSPPATTEESGEPPQMESYHPPQRVSQNLRISGQH